ncbi:uncharacterized protein BDR25DRAFT_318792 [Lindgomyces ingoldianus]|uniref:Uncharacterized protein n=1 Tax=Lindgomyces ingoldianus TaxID=673940 RepID=A0ACB6QG20_9PLEO|nr:uncharacterized protein BDR25DRAFT_318792 [Lindgomyces ingoldianus]KAF2465095.1 hypothetical protein BDR25DRAFT_318792 [Lindgomyces ingoldianus]
MFFRQTQPTPGTAASSSCALNYSKLAPTVNSRRLLPRKCDSDLAPKLCQKPNFGPNIGPNPTSLSDIDDFRTTAEILQPRCPAYEEYPKSPRAVAGSIRGVVRQVCGRAMAKMRLLHYFPRASHSPQKIYFNSEVSHPGVLSKNPDCVISRADRIGSYADIYGRAEKFKDEDGEKGNRKGIVVGLEMGVKVVIRVITAGSTVNLSA